MAAPYNLSFNPVWDFVNLTGQQVDDTYYLFTLSNIFPYAYSPVYMSQSGGYWSDPIQLLSNGTLPTNVYWDPDVVYRLELRQGNMQSDPLIYLIENYIPIDSGTGPGPTPATGNNSTDNVITNPQFVDVPFVSPFTITTSGTTQIAPGWQITTTGSGTLTVSQVNINGVNAISPKGTNESYYLSIANNNFATVTLQQVFNMNGALWTGQAAALSLSVNPTAPVTIDAYLSYSGNVQQSTSFFNQLIDSTGWQSFTQAISIDPSVNTNVGAAAYTTLNIMWSGNLTVNITSIQLLGQAVADSTVSYGQIPIERQIDHEFHYYQPGLNFKPIPSLLTGWDFVMNPAQFGANQTITTVPAYIWDQTICASALNNFNVTKPSQTGAFNAVSTVANDGFYMLQYLSTPSAWETELGLLSSNVFAYCNTHPGVTGSVHLYSGNPSSVIPPLSGGTIGIISIVSGKAIFTLTAANWTEIPQLIPGSNVFSLPFLQLIDNPLNNWDSFVPNVGVSNFAIVVVFNVPSAGTSVVVNSISCVQGSVATRPAPQTADEVLRECQYYYERSWAPGISTGTATLTNAIVLSQGASPQITLASGAVMHLTYFYNQEAFNVEYKTVKRAAATPVVYSTMTANLPGAVTSYLAWISALPPSSPTSGSTIIDVGITPTWGAVNPGINGFNYNIVPENLNNAISSGPTQTVGGSSYYYASASISFHYVIDARLGMV